MRRIVVTGLGAVTPLAAGVEASWSRLLAGRSGIRRLPDDMAGDLPAKIGAAVPSLEEDPDAGFDPDAALAPKDQRKVDRFILFAKARPVARHLSVPERAGMNEVLRKAMTIGDAPEVVARTILEAATASSPRRRYAAGKMARQVSFLRRFVPESAFDKA